MKTLIIFLIIIFLIVIVICGYLHYNVFDEIVYREECRIIERRYGGFMSPDRLVLECDCKNQKIIRIGNMQDYYDNQSVVIFIWKNKGERYIFE